MKLPGFGAEAVTGNRLRDDFLFPGRQCLEQPPHLCGSLDSAWGKLVPLFCLPRSLLFGVMSDSFTWCSRGSHNLENCTYRVILGLFRVGTEDTDGSQPYPEIFVYRLDFACRALVLRVEGSFRRRCQKQAQLQSQQLIQPPK